jgi:LuxR family transcriptional regulator, maltose regulon positive regulatory protein
MNDVVSVRDRIRFRGPTVRTSVVRRSRLDGRYASATGRVLRVLAPAGYGKSTQVWRWVDEDYRRTHWLDLEPIDNDPLVLARAIAIGLVEATSMDPDDGANEATPFDDVAKLVAAPVEPFVLVLDDIHHLVSDESAALIDLIIGHLSRDSLLVLVGRSQHRAESVARHRLDPGVVDVTADDLAFDLSETEELLTALGVEADVDMLTALDEQFEGWPAGIRLAGQVLATRQGTARLPLQKLGDLSYVTDYITQEWFGAIAPADQAFLTELGCLERFSGRQCDDVLGRNDSASVLRRLCHGDLMLIGLDEHDEWYRMHAVLSRWLSARLRSRDPDRWRAVHLAASAWWSTEGDADLAIEHAVAADEPDLVELLMMQHCGVYAARGMYRTINRWLGHFSDDRIRESLPMQQAKAVVNIGEGDGEQALRWARRCATTDLPAGRVPDSVAESLHYQTDALVAALETHPARDLVPVADRASRHLPHGEWRGLACLALGANQYLCGQPGAIESLREALFENKVAKTTTLQATTAAVLAIVLDLEGSPEEAAALSYEAIRLLASPLGKDAAGTAVSLAIASLVDARAGRHEDAIDRRDAAREKLASFERSGPWFGILGVIPLIRTSLLVDDAHTALELQQELEAKMMEQDSATPLARHIDDLGDAVRGAIGAFADRTWALTGAELRVLQYLPTNLSLSDIAEQLFVARNTVKSHAAAIYRKLGTTSRTDAVDLARAAGLLTQPSPKASIAKARPFGADAASPTGGSDPVTIVGR